MPDDELVHYEVASATATITLDSPGNRNALSARLVAELHAHLERAAADPAVRAVVLTHTGTTFCAGADLTEMTAGDTGQGGTGQGGTGQGGTGQGTRNMLRLFTAIAELPKPVLARLAGGARAGGVGLVGACDIALAVPDAKFAFSEVRLGLAPVVISLVTLPRLDDRSAARYYLTGDVFDGAEAARIGLLTDATADLDGRLGAYLESLRSCSPQGLAESKALTAAGIRTALADRGEAMAQLSGRLFASAEAQEGMRSFLERRPPRWAAG